MTLAETSIRRPVLAIVLSVAIVLFGAISFTRLGVREYPAVDTPTISVSTNYPGAAAEVIEAQITEPLEEAMNSVAGIRTLTSISREGSSQITAEFTLDTDLDTAASDMRDQISRAVRNLPADANPPVLSKADADSQPIFGLTFSSEKREQLELSGFADAMKERLQTVPGIAAVTQPGEKRYAMRLWLDPEKLAAYNLTPLDIRQALNRENVELPSGRIEGQSVEFSVKTLSRLSTFDDFNNLIVKRSDDRIVRFRDIGNAELGALNERASLKIGTKPVAGLFFRPQPGANQVEIVDELRRRIDRLRKEIPSDVSMEIVFDNTTYVRHSIAEVKETIVIAFALVVLVVFFFFREWRTTLIPVIAIPVSIIGVFSVMAAAGFSINVLTLLGIVLAIGLVVDDAIVVLENIYSKVERGVPPIEAGIQGTKEIFVAVVATTVTLAVVFLPLLFMGGLSGKLFREFGVTIAGAVIISAVVALTLTPMLSSRLLKRRTTHGWLFLRTEPFFHALDRSYVNGLRRVLHRRWLGVVVLVVASGLIVFFLGALRRELSPLEDRGRIWIRAIAAEGASFDYMSDLMADITNVARHVAPESEISLTQLPGVTGGGIGAVNNGSVRLFLVEKDKRKRSQEQIADALNRAVRNISGGRIAITQEPSIGERRGGTGVSAQLVIQAPNMDALQEVLPKFMEAARKRPEFTFIDSDLKFNKPELQVSIDRDKAQMIGVTADDVARTLQAALSGQRFGYFLRNGKQYEIIAQLTRDFRSRPADLGNLPVRTATGETVRLDNVIRLSERVSPPELYRFNRYVSATITGQLVRGGTVGEGVDALRTIARTTLDDRFTTELVGASRDFVESSSSLGYVFALALLLIYLVLAAQFESFRDPFVILLTVPLALSGALFGLWFFNQTLNVFSQIGLIMLVGLVTKNGILIVEFANQRRLAGLDPLAAVQDAAGARLRPILMTTLATILGILPIALALGAGAESRVSMGIAVIGGLIVGGALTLYVIPSVYVIVCRRGVVHAAPAKTRADEVLPVLESLEAAK